MMHCKKATFLLSKKEEAKLTWLEQVKLSAHLGICHSCKRFEKQTILITCLIREIRKKETLPDTVKEHMQAQLK
jgi:hypothetical protein